VHPGFVEALNELVFPCCKFDGLDGSQCFGGRLEACVSRFKQLRAEDRSIPPLQRFCSAGQLTFFCVFANNCVIQPWMGVVKMRTATPAREETPLLEAQISLIAILRE
jgi:hypothetical protein